MKLQDIFEGTAEGVDKIKVAEFAGSWTATVTWKDGRQNTVHQRKGQSDLEKLLRDKYGSRYTDKVVR